jgi:dihydrofolate synthase/folylpolyglutamate synthase
MDYPGTITFIESLMPREFKPDLAPLTEACHLFGNPSLAFPTIHIAGTNGKGSTATFLSSILMHNGYRVGLFTSPHLLDIRERIQINRQMISPEEFTRLTDKIRETLPNERALSYFEFLTLMAFLYFQENKVDIAIIETGLGGRLDATNVIQPQVVIITPIAFDHKRHLGHTLADIAKEKCGIIKRGVPTVLAEQTPEVMEVIRRWCDDLGSPLCIASPDEISQPLGLAGRHQKQNAACAVEAANLLPHTLFDIKVIDEALLDTHWMGRLEVVHEVPRVILDGAHNPAGAKVLADYISEQFKKDQTILMLGILADKDIKGICRHLIPRVKEVICVRAPSERGASPKDLAAVARSFGVNVHIEDEIHTALGKWLKKLKGNENLVITGSLTVVGEAKKFFDHKINIQSP